MGRGCKVAQASRGATETAGHSKVLEAKAAEHSRTYSPSKVIHSWRGEPLFTHPQPTVNNFGVAAKMFGETLTFWLNRKAEHAGHGRRIPHSNVLTFNWRDSLRDPAPRLQGILTTLRLH